MIRGLALLALLSCAAGCAKSPPAAAPPVVRLDPLQQLRHDLMAATRMPGVTHGVWGVAVHSLARDERLFALNEQALLVPASAAKIVSAATAAEAVGWDYRYETALLITGPIVDGTVQGDLIVVGSGDPTIGGRAGEDLEELVAVLAQLGITRISGRIVGDDDSLEEPRPQLGWTWDDLGYPSGALFGALNLAENRMAVTIAPSPTPGEPALISVDPDVGDRPLINRTVTAAPGSPSMVWPEQRPGETGLTIAGTVPVDGSGAQLSVSAGNPTLWFVDVLRRRLLGRGIVSEGAADIDDLTPRPDRRSATLLATYRSRPLRDIVQPLLKESINLYAEALFRLNAAPGTLPTNDAALEGARVRLQAWGVAADGQQLVDGSGLSRRNVVSAAALLAVLRQAHLSDPTSPLFSALPVAGVDGSLANRMRGTAAEGNVRAKTGTMSNIRSLAGYVTTRDNEPLAFVMMVNNFEGAGAQAHAALDAMAVRLADFSRKRPRPGAGADPAGQASADAAGSSK